MRVPGRRAGALAILGTIAFTNCAWQRASAGNDEPPVERRRIGHGCKGATVKVRLPLLTQVDQSPAEALREPAAQEAEAAPPEDQQLGERAARAVQRAIEAAIPGTACRLINDRWYWIVECMDEGQIGRASCRERVEMRV